jgi:phytoene dehydrogenase-like protein
LLARLSSLNWRALEGTPLSAWLDEALRDPTLRELFGALYRLTSYANAPETQSAGAAVGQLAFSTKTGVVYLDGGWQTLVDGTVAACAAHGVVIRTGAAVTEARPLAGGWAVRCADGSAVACRTLVLATSPGAAAAITRIGALDSWASAAIPAKAACLDVALESLPRPGTRLALGIDQPLYFSVHSASARLAPEGGALVSTIKYLPHGEAPDAKRDATELEAWLDRLQPGWRERVIARRYLPQLVVSHAIPTASQGGLEGRPPTRVPDAERLFVVGDWVGHEGVLLDAVLASAEAAGGAILEDERLATVA